MKYLKLKNMIKLGIDLGPNSIGWALINQSAWGSGSLLAAGTRIIPMSQDELGKFDAGQSVSRTTERTRYRSTRRLRERYLLRRQRLHRVLHILDFLPQHYAEQIDFNKHPGQFKDGTEPKLAYYLSSPGSKPCFLFMESFAEMLADFRQHNPVLLEGNKKISYDWTIYFLRKKALTQKITGEELAWLLLHFNQKRGYYQLRGEEEEENLTKKVEYYSLKVIDVTDSGDRKNKDEIWYNVHLENGWIYRRTSRTPLDWTGKVKDFIVTTEYNADGTIKTDKEGQPKRSFRAPSNDDWTLLKKKTEHDIEASRKRVGEYIYDQLLANPQQKIKGKLVRVIERKYYQLELKDILETQKKFHPQLSDQALYEACLDELYPFNDPHRNSIRQKDFTYLFLEDILFYQRPLKSKKALISNCRFETRSFIKEGKPQQAPVKAIPKSHPLFQEFRIWQFIQNLKIYQRGLSDDIDITDDFLSSADDKVALFDWLNSRKDVNQKAFLKQFLKIKKVDDYRWNYGDEKSYPCNETRSLLLSVLQKAGSTIQALTPAQEEELWHILYSVDDRNDIIKALRTFAVKNNLGEDIADQLKKIPRLEKEYGAYSAKALKKLLPLMRLGKYWNEEEIIKNMPLYRQHIDQLITTLRQKEEAIAQAGKEKSRVINRKLLYTLEQLQDEITAYAGLAPYLASYLVYGRHAEEGDAQKWKTPEDIRRFLQQFRQHSLRNPIVEQVVRETLQVVHDIWIYYGQGRENFFDEIHVELGRELKNSAEKRKQLSKQVAENENTNLRIKALLLELFEEGKTENVRPYSPMQQEILKIYEEGRLGADYGKIPDDILKISTQGSPSSSDLKKYRLWLEQGYRSPYTGNIIPLNRLFTPAYEIEHIIPQSRYFDDSLSNKVICEADINTHKDNRTAYQYIKAMDGTKISTSFGKELTLLRLNDYEEAVKKNFARNRAKLKKLLMEDIPESFIERQMNDSRYISKLVKNYLSNIVRAEDEQETTSKNLLPVPGGITARMRKDWGLEDIWNELITPRFMRLNEMTGTRDFGDINPTTKKFLPTVPLNLQKGFSKKRIDHRHHALDAIVIACITREHINYLNAINSERNNYSLVARLREVEEIMIDGKNRRVAKAFHKPWTNFTKDIKETLSGIIVSFKQNLRVISKTTNRYSKWQADKEGNKLKIITPQVQSFNYAIRKPLHKETVYGLVKLKFRKTVTLAAAIDASELITDRELKRYIASLKQQQWDKKKILQHFKANGNIWQERDITRVERFYWDIDHQGMPANVAARAQVDESFTRDKIATITDTAIQKIMLAHLGCFDEEKEGKKIERPELAFSPEGIDKMNRNILALNDGKPHQPIYKVRIYEPRGNKFAVGHKGNKQDKFVEAAKGTNLFFAIYRKPDGKRVYDTIPLNIVIERLKQGLAPVPETNEEGHPLLMHLSPNDLVYMPEESSVDTGDIAKGLAFKNISANRVYKVVSCTGNQCFFIKHCISTPIVNKYELSSQNKMEKSIDGMMIKECCMKMNIDRLGHIIEPGH